MIDQPRICLAGASPDTGNLGVSALCLAALRTIFDASAAAKVTVFDEGQGCRSDRFQSDGRSFAYRLCGEKSSRRYWQRESLWNIRVSGWLGGLANASARSILSADAVLDVSGGDSFTDLYGPRRFAAVTMLKRIVLEREIPLILLPQTYGPFADARRHAAAVRIIAGATMAWARDRHSFGVLKELLGERFDPARHQCGVDMAFALDSCEPAGSVCDQMLALMSTGRPLVGLNVSGLLFNSPDGGKRDYGLKADYREMVIALVKRLLEQSDCHVIFIPHVVTPRGHFESDVAACEAVAGEFADSAARVTVAPALSDPRQIKWVIGQCDWFCGTRMHSTIAALSSGIATAAIAYSHKTAGVFDSCGLAERVVDPRKLQTDEAVEALWHCWQNRAADRVVLRDRLPHVTHAAQEQMRIIIDRVSHTAQQDCALQHA